MTESYVYIRYLGEIEQKLAFGTYHPERIAFFRKLERAAKRTGYDIDDLGNLVDFVGERVNPQDYPDTEFDYLGLENMEADTGRVISYRRLHGAAIRSISTAFHKGSILFARLRPYLNKVHRAEQNGIGSGELYIINAKEGRILSDYLLTYLLSELTLNQTKWILSGSSYPRLGEDDFTRLKIVFPKKRAAQKRLVKIARRVEMEATRYETNASKFVQTNRNLILKSLDLEVPSDKVGYFTIYSDELDHRLDFVRNHPTTRATLKMLDEVGAVPLGKLIEQKVDYGVNAFGKDEGETPFINIQNLSLDGTIDDQNVAYVDRPKDDKLLMKDDILISRSRTVGTSSLVREPQVGFTFGSYVLRMRVRPDAKVSPAYLVNFINSGLGQLQVTYLQTGARAIERGGGNNINPDQLKQMGIVLPDDTTSQETMVIQIMRNLKHAEQNREKAHKKRMEAKQVFVKEILAR